MKKSEFRPFENESDCIQIGDLTVENRVDRVSIYGSIDLTKDKAGLATALLLKGVIDRTISALESADLPDHVSVRKSTMVENPFA